VLYLNEGDLDQPGVNAWLAGEEAKKWTVLARHERDGEYWMLLNRSLPPKQKPAKAEDK